MSTTATTQINGASKRLKRQAKKPAKPMTPKQFLAAIEALGHNQSSYARMMIELGDPRSFPSLLRSMSNWTSGATTVPPEMHVVLTLLRREILDGS